MTDGLKVALAVITGFLLLVGGWYAVGLSGVASESTYPPPATLDYAKEFKVAARQVHKPTYWLGPDFDHIQQVVRQRGSFLSVSQYVPVSDAPGYGPTIAVETTTVYGVPPEWMLELKTIERRSVGHGETVIITAPGDAPITPDVRRAVHANLQIYHAT